jgi:hypothetical protein
MRRYLGLVCGAVLFVTLLLFRVQTVGASPVCDKQCGKGTWEADGTDQYRPCSEEHPHCHWTQCSARRTSCTGSDGPYNDSCDGLLTCNDLE